MKEWDTASYVRKYSSSFVVMRDVKSGQKRTAYVTDFTANGFEWLDPVSGAGQTSKLTEYEFLYQHIPSGWWGRNACLIRKNEMVFSVGINTTSHRLYYPYEESLKIDSGLWGSSRWRSLDLAQGLPIVTPGEKEEALDNYGRISTKLYLGTSSIYYLAQRIGRRDKRRLEIPAILRQEFSDALKGHTWLAI